MILPFSIDEFLHTFKLYNDATWPAHIIGYCIAAAILLMLLLRHRFTSIVSSSFLALAWIWTGVFYHIIFFSRINKAAIAFGIVFIIQGIAFLWYGVVKNRIKLRLERDTYRIIAPIIIFYAMIGYPVAAYLLGQSYPRVPVFPIAPCPLTIFTLGMLLFSIEKAPRIMWIIPLIWSVIGFTAALKMSILEDYGLLLSGALCAMALIIAKRNNSTFSIRK